MRRVNLWVVAVAVAVIVASVWFAVAQQRKTVDAALSNCQQIEVIKAQIRGTVEDSVKRLPTIEYYREHPAELKRAISDSKKSLARFKAIDCYTLTGHTRP